MTGETIPDLSRALVRLRAGHRCEHCRVPAPHGHWHHRRSRSVRDVHRHCPCNGVWLCPTCHAWVHANPFEARKFGLIVSRYVAQPFTIPVTTPWGERLHDCNGQYNLIHTFNR